MFWQFVLGWLRSRGFGQILLGTPAIAFALVFVFIVYAGQSVHDTKIIADYRLEATQAFRQGNPQAAELWLRKVAYLDQQTPEMRFGLAISAAEHGDQARAQRIMADLAPGDARGFAPAHFWQAGELLKSLDPANKDQVARVRSHLQHGLDDESANLAAREQLAKIELSQENLSGAIEQYQLLEAADRSFAFLLSKLHILAGDQEAARKVADRGIEYFKRKVATDASDLDSRIQWARLEGFLERFDQVTQILLEGASQKSEMSPEDLARLRVELGSAYFGWSEAARRSNPDNVSEQLTHLQNALKFSPDNSHVLEALAELARADSPTAETAYASLSRSLAEGTATPMVHLILAMAAFERGEFRREQQHLELALAGDPGLVVAANNLAWRLAATDPPQLKKAFELIDHAVRAAPERLEFRATRGRIHHLLGRTMEAIIDLEAALSGLSERSDINDALADVYEEIGDDELAQQHRARADNIRTKKAPRSPRKP